MKTKRNKKLFTGTLEHLGGKKLSQQGVEFSQKVQKARKHPTRGFRGQSGKKSGD
jgi:hypothetical protein